MTRRAWVRLDNASNIFLAARSEADPKVFRLSAEMDHEVDPALLQTALDETFDRYPLYHAVLRRGVFWYYLQDSDLRPQVVPETLPTCAPLYRGERHSLLFRVIRSRRRIVLEVFHALSDGTGALWFLTDLVTAYVRLRFPEEHSPETGGAAGSLETGGASIAPLDPGQTAATRPDSSADRIGANVALDPAVPPSASPETAVPPDEPAAEVSPGNTLTTDSFAHHFRRRRHRHRRRRAAAQAEGTAAEAGAGPAPVPEPADPAAADEDTAQPVGHRGLGRFVGASTARTHTVRGTRTPDNRTRAVELTMPAAEVLGLARAEGVSLTMYLTAVFFEAVRLSSGQGEQRGDLGRSPTLAASVPVNLRQFFPSTSARNFFATVRVEHTYGEERTRDGDREDAPADGIGAICRNIDAQFRPQAAPAALESKLRRFIRFERMLALRVVPRPLKDVVLGLFNRASNRGLTVAVSNLGRVSLPEPAEAHVGRMLFHVSAVRPQFCAISHGGLLTVTFTSPFAETDHVREFARILSGKGVPLTVAAARVTEDELAGISGGEAGR
ncbi:alcohol acetyltransferase [Brevibacterium salitolerans]|uniref:Alcohol acetyltransferase n=1 Tax=Brevibacterium salitolerans TaxID=1403566 RepID=A0ABN2WUX0_9MICO